MQKTSKILIAGLEYEIEFSERLFIKPAVIQHSNKIIVHKGELSHHSHKQILLEWLKKVARKTIEERSADFAQKYNFEYNKISIRDQATRWGSCSSKGNLNFNWRLILAPIEILDYVVIHELAHTREMNHSSRFWKIVEDIMPNYKILRRWLRENSKEVRNPSGLRPSPL